MMDFILVKIDLFLTGRITKPFLIQLTVSFNYYSETVIESY